ncbi:hypothetical protein [Sphingomonas sp. S2M10]|uniref:hypothetical protein n=1 Tax=Sphingomonas sp. S2M10 TaxID=2705010 RepID=UPI0014566EDA|nr:hypothetical protein [Sphingomonas sp. S2M10]
MLCTTSCSNLSRSIAVTPDPAKLDACPAADSQFPALPPLVPIVLPAGTVVTAMDGTRRTIAAPLEVVDYSLVLDRDEATAVFVVRERADKKLCRSAVQYVRDWSAGMAKKP